MEHYQTYCANNDVAFCSFVTQDGLTLALAVILLLIFVRRLAVGWRRQSALSYWLSRHFEHGLVPP